ncbi:uncharacterized protein MELLADRAFT_95950 [Melampsora larici-populina 98AG31]|uniref:DUF7872 domain-containing protein n=1 Tax=Melampsora larici-populina (strain 98AG31 / pathotype 3-4-7) TaxID=747676 RepID=F4RDV3_MELLP|nr:uncharacterized protein MELLADRAFT_95950 [Melampsora larici-populina 98AG31]EGG09544.1 hypothetical protein MELLADRAFT_95950 [Melampsora larici-populina 98AG31]
MAILLVAITLALPAASLAAGIGPSAPRPDFPDQRPTFFALNTPKPLLTNASHTNHTINFPHTNHTTNNTQVTKSDLENECLHQPLTPSLWSNLSMNAYLDNYPGGKNWTVEKYATRVGATDFVCGIGKVCSPGQICESVRGRDWYALVAVENWNNFVNSVYEAAGDAFNEVSAVLPTMSDHRWISLVTADRHGKRSYSYTSAHICMGGVKDSIWLSWGTLSWLGIVMSLYQISAFSWVNTLLIVGNGENRFGRSSDVTWMLGEAQHAVQETISNITQKVITSGISTPEGLSSINRDGLFLTGLPVIDQNAVQKEFERSLKLKTLIKLWRIQNAFIVRGSEPCTYSGPNGAMNDPDIISYCGEDGVLGDRMMNIARAELQGDGFDPTIYHADLVEYKYGFTAEFLTTSSWECQTTHHTFEYDPYTNQTESSYINPRRPDDCLVNLPVCDCTNPDVVAARKKGQSLTKACRNIAGLPI